MKSEEKERILKKKIMRTAVVDMSPVPEAPRTLNVQEIVAKYPEDTILHCSQKHSNKDYEVLEWPQGRFLKDSLSGGDTMMREYLGRLGHFRSEGEARSYIRRRKEAIVAAQSEQPMELLEAA